MTVAELIAKLSEFPPDLPVVIPGTGMDEGAMVEPAGVQQELFSVPDKGDCYADPDAFETKRFAVAIVTLGGVRSSATMAKPTKRDGDGLFWWTNIKPGEAAPSILESDLPDEVYLKFTEPGLLPDYPDPRGLRGGSQIFDWWRRAAGFLTHQAAMDAYHKALAAITSSTAAPPSETPRSTTPRPNSC